MTYFHFTALCFLKNIRSEGLTKGKMLKSIRPISWINNRQWLTTNPIFDQSWLNPNSTLPYKRNEVRLTLEIPEFAIENVRPWNQLKFLVPDVAQDLSAFGDPENWYVYEGNIPAQWIEKIDYMKPEQPKPNEE